MEKIRQIQGNNTSLKVASLISNNTVISENQEIGETLAKHFFEKFRSKINPTPHEALTATPPISSTITTFLNSSFSHTELTSAIQSSKNTAIGPDDFPYIFLKKLSFEGQRKLLEMYNLIWTSNTIPNQWLTSVIIPLKNQIKPLPLPVLTDQYH